MTFTNTNMEYRVTLDTELNQFVVYAQEDATKVAVGQTIQEAVSALRQII